MGGISDTKDFGCHDRVLTDKTDFRARPQVATMAVTKPTVLNIGSPWLAMTRPAAQSIL